MGRSAKNCVAAWTLYVAKLLLVNKVSSVGWLLAAISNPLGFHARLALAGGCHQHKRHEVDGMHGKQALSVLKYCCVNKPP
jgi:hypothetical protein